MSVASEISNDHQCHATLGNGKRCENATKDDFWTCGIKTHRKQESKFNPATKSDEGAKVGVSDKAPSPASASGAPVPESIHLTESEDDCPATPRKSVKKKPVKEDHLVHSPDDASSSSTTSQGKKDPLGCLLKDYMTKCWFPRWREDLDNEEAYVRQQKALENLIKLNKNSKTAFKEINHADKRWEWIQTFRGDIEH